MTMARVRPYGSWPSPITADLIVAETVGLGGVWLDGDEIWWAELRPSEGGRTALLRRLPDGETQECVPAPFSARTRVNEYGGGAVAVADGTAYFSNDADQRVYRVEPGRAPEPLTPPGERRYADLVVDRTRRRLLAVCEDHGAAAEPEQSLVAIPIDAPGAPRTLARGRDFYAAPRPSPDGRRLAYLAWDHPNMPWDGTELLVNDVGADGGLHGPRRVAGGRDEAVCMPAFAPDGALYYVSDRTNWWNLYREGGRAAPLLAMDAELGAPHWVFGLSTYAFATPHRLVAARSERGIWRLGVLDLAARRWHAVETPYTDIGYVRAHAGRAVFIGAGPARLPEIACWDLARGRFEVVRRSAAVPVDAGCISPARTIEYATGDGERAHAFFYPPRNDAVAAPAGERPPLIVTIHGGPTAAATSALTLKLQYWTSRGFAVLDVNYRGSTGFGRAYRRRLDGAWGVADVEDCVHGARWLGQQGEVDAARLAIRGGSAGGYTALCALAFHRTFAAGAVYYGVSDLERLAQDTHKFESRYLERLIGPYPAARELYRQRSPIHHAERLGCPIIFFQGLEDRVVPPSQTERLAQALRARGVPVAYLSFAGERHGFRAAQTVKRALEWELRFYGSVFGFATDVDEAVPDPLAAAPAR